MGNRIDKYEPLDALREIRAIHVEHLAALEGLVKRIDDRLAAIGWPVGEDADHRRPAASR